MPLGKFFFPVIADGIRQGMTLLIASEVFIVSSCPANAVMSSFDSSSLSSGRKVTVPPGKSVKVELRLDWPGTGSVPAVRLMDPAASCRYQVRLLLVVEGDGKRYAASGPMRVELPAK
jgi:hypothetical protein